VGAAQGSTWQVPSTGRQYIYIGTTWYPTVGTGSIDTGELANYAATMVASDAWTPKQYTHSAYPTSHLFLWCTLTNPTNETLAVQLTVSMTFDFFQGIANGNNLIMYAGAYEYSEFLLNGRIFETEIVTATPRYLPLTKMRTLTIGPGQTLQFCAGFFCSYWGIDALAPNNTEMRILDSQLRVEMIKR
jgi:hypothetical protein